jgi:hypothetical protein
MPLSGIYASVSSDKECLSVFVMGNGIRAAERAGRVRINGRMSGAVASKQDNIGAIRKMPLERLTNDSHDVSNASKRLGSDGALFGCTCRRWVLTTLHPDFFKTSTGSLSRGDHIIDKAPFFPERDLLNAKILPAPVLPSSAVQWEGRAVRDHPSRIKFIVEGVSECALFGTETHVVKLTIASMGCVDCRAFSTTIPAQRSSESRFENLRNTRAQPRALL